MCRGTLYIHQLGTTTLASALVTEKTFGAWPSNNDPDFWDTSALEGGFCSLDSSPNQMLCSRVRSRGDNRKTEIRPEDQLQRKHHVNQGKEDYCGLLRAREIKKDGDHTQAVLQSKLLTTEIRDRQIKMLLNFFIYNKALDTHSHPLVCESRNLRLTKGNPALKRLPAFLLPCSVNK